MPRDTHFPNQEKRFELRLPERAYAVVRVDGHTFSRFTRQFERPFSEPFATAMDAVGQRLATLFTGVLCAYVQSDEASVVFTDLRGEKAQYPFSGRVNKLASLAASNATAAFMQALPGTDGLPTFDARAFALTTFADVVDYIHHRRLDARKNAITMAASTIYSHKELAGVSTKQRMDLLERNNYGLLPERFFNGRLIHPVQVREAITYTTPRHTATTMVDRTRWVVEPATLATTETVLAAAKAGLPGQV